MEKIFKFGLCIKMYYLKQQLNMCYKQMENQKN